jgi:hypothetical protein
VGDLRMRDTRYKWEKEKNLNIKGLLKMIKLTISLAYLRMIPNRSKGKSEISKNSN